MQPLNSSEAQPESNNTAIIDEEARREDTRRLTATHANPRTCQNEQPVMATSSNNTQPEGVRDGSTDSEANAAPLTGLNSNNTALSPEARPTDKSKNPRIMARLDQLKIMEQNKGGEFEGYIRSLEDVKEVQEAIDLLRQNEEQTDQSAGYPQTEDGFEAHCRVLFDAMKNMNNIRDAVGAPGGNGQSSSTRSKDSIAVKTVKSKASWEIEFVAGKLMGAILKAQLGGLSVPGTKVHKYDSFTLRFRAVVDALMVSKLMVRSAFQSNEWIDRIAVNPDEELERKRTNKKINDTKGRKQKFAEEMKKKDPSIDFKNNVSPKSAETNNSAAIPSPAAQTEQQSNQGSAVPSPQAETDSDASPASPPSKRVKISQEPIDQLEEEDGPSSPYENNANQREQPPEERAIDHDQQELQTPQDGSFDDDPTSPRLDEEATYWAVDGGSEQMERGSAPFGMSRAHVASGGGHGTAGHDGQFIFAQGGPLNLDPNPFNVPGPIREYDFGTYGPAAPDFHRQRSRGRARFRVFRPDESQYEDEDRQGQDGHYSTHYDS